MPEQEFYDNLYTKGEFWDALPDFLASQAPKKVDHVVSMLEAVGIARVFPAGSGTIVDIGCGAGKVVTGIAEKLEQRHPELSIEAIGYDKSPQAIKYAKSNNDRGTFICSDFQEADQSQWDLALLIDIMEHVPDPDEFLRATAERARFVIASFAMDDNVANRMSADRRKKVAAMGHVSLYDEKRAVELSARHGQLVAADYIENALRRNFRVKSARSLITLPVRITLQAMSRRWKGGIFGGESIYTLIESSDLV